MKMLDASEVQQVSGGDLESEQRLQEFLRAAEDYMRRQRDSVPFPDFT